MNKTNTSNNSKNKTVNFGSWKSPISAKLLTKANKNISEPRIDGDDIYWLESRPLEKGRTCIVKRTKDGQQRDVLPAPLNARSRVNEYGGGSYCVNDGVVYFVLFDDQRVYAIDTKTTIESKVSPIPLTPDADGVRYGDLSFDPIRKTIYAVCENHNSQQKDEPETTIVAISVEHFSEKDSCNLSTPKTLCEGADFYSNPNVSPDGKKISWLCWHHPNLPWDATECWVGDLDEQGNILNPSKIAGDTDESIFQPTWSPSNELFFSSDKNNWWNIYRYNFQTQQQELIHREDAEYATPQWVFGLSTFGFLNQHTLLTTYTKNGLWYLATLDISTQPATKNIIDTEATDIGYVIASNNSGLFVGANAQQFEALNRYDVSTNTLSTLIESGSPPVSSDYISSPEIIEFPVSSEANEKNTTSVGHAFFYSPKNSDYSANEKSNNNESQKPPLLVFCHGGPTASTHAALNLKIQFWTSRGFAVADINYGGSTGYGRQYRDRLKKQWGIVDVQDVIDCVNYLSTSGKIDPEKTAIRGGSAGGYTVLAALTFHNTFKAGTSLYGIGDLETLATDTHKFESRYLDQLIGPYPELKHVYQQRSPIHSVDQLNCPVLFLQGLKDKVVPPNQAEAMVDALDQQNIPVAYVTFADEGHGFRQSENIIKALEAELFFYASVFGFTLPENIPSIPIEHLKAD